MPADKFAHVPPIPRDRLPTMYDLPSEDPKEPGVRDEFHYYQALLLRETFVPPTYEWDRYFISSNLYLYYDVEHTNRYKRPDWFVVLDHPRLYAAQDMRLSYVIWQERASPYLVVELLAPGTEKEDLGQVRRDSDGIPGKWEVYERYLQVPYYVVFSRYTDELHYFVLEEGGYREHVSKDGCLWLKEAQLGLGLWTGRYDRFEQRRWLRFFDADGEWIPTPLERERQSQQQTARERQRAEQERQRAEQARYQADEERERAEQARQQAERLAAKLRALGIDPEAE